jgi:L-ascorbate metabolism protein UlaG (beta-lactamase superfamily)
MAIESITFAGHSAVFIKTSEGIVAIDPWLEANPACPEALKSPDTIDLIVLTHGHADHASEAVRYAKRLGSTLAATYELALIMGSEGVPQDNLRPMNKGGSITWNGLTITLTNAFHSSSYDKADGTTVYAGEACGVVISDGTKTVYHAGDTCLFSDMKDIGQRYKPDVALLPIGDVFTMGPAEAAEAAKRVGCGVAIPIHYNTFDLLTGTAEEFSSACSKAGVTYAVIEPGGTYSVS